MVWVGRQVTAIGSLEDNRGYYYELTDLTTGDWQKALRDQFTNMPQNKTCHFRIVINGAHKVGYGFRANANYAVYSVLGYGAPYEVRAVLSNGVWTFTEV